MFVRVQVPVLVLLSLAAAHAPAAEPASGPSVEIVVDTSDVPEMAEYGRGVKRVAEQWYPKIAGMLPSDGFTPPARVVITFRRDYKGVAETRGDRVLCSVRWFQDHPGDVGAVVHELVHVVQAYRRRPPPVWLTEGIADEVRWFRYEPPEKHPRPDPRTARYDASYQTTAAFQHWAQERYDEGLVRKLNAACREGKYDEDLWKQYTGKALRELGREWKDSLKPKEGGR